MHLQKVLPEFATKAQQAAEEAKAAAAKAKAAAATKAASKPATSGEPFTGAKWDCMEIVEAFSKRHRKDSEPAVMAKETWEVHAKTAIIGLAAFSNSDTWRIVVRHFLRTLTALLAPAWRKEWMYHNAPGASSLDDTVATWVYEQALGFATLMRNIMAKWKDMERFHVQVRDIAFSKDVRACFSTEGAYMETLTQLLLM